MNKILNLSIAFVVGMLSCFTASAQHESEAAMSFTDYYSTFLERPFYGTLDYALKPGSNYKGEIVIPGKIRSSELNTMVKVSWITWSAFSKSESPAWTNATSVFIPASATEYKTYLNRTTELGYTSVYKDGSFSITANPNLKTATYESPHPSFGDINVMICWYKDLPGAPTWEHCDQVSAIIESEFISNPFAECPSLKSIVVLDPNTRLHSIKGVLFKDYDDCQELVAYPTGRHDKEYNIPEPTYCIREGAFNSECKLKKITLPKTLTNMHYEAFNSLTSLTTVIVNWTEPIPFFSPLFSDNTYNNGTLIVPPGTRAAYASTIPWSRFSKIVENTSGIDTPMTSSPELTCDVYSISGVQCKSRVAARDWQDGLAPGIYILRMSDGSTLKHVIK